MLDRQGLTGSEGGSAESISLISDQDGISVLFRSIPVAVMVSDSSTGMVIEMNDACLDLFGTTRAEVLGRTLVEAGLSFVVDMGRQGRSLKSAEATVGDSAGARVTCRLYTASAVIDKVRVVVSVLLDSQMEKSIRGFNRSDRAPAGMERRSAGARKPLALLLLLKGAEKGSTSEMLQLLGFDVVSESTPKLLLELTPLGRNTALVVVDSPSGQDEADSCLEQMATSLPQSRKVVIVDPGTDIGSVGRGAVLLRKPVSINDLADSAR